MTTTTLSVPGRVNLIGEHIDYHNQAVLPMAIQRGISIQFTSRADLVIQARSHNFGERTIDMACELTASPDGDWSNYIKAAVQAIQPHWKISRGLDAVITADLPPAAGLSSSSALLIAFTLALLKANHIEASAQELMSILPNGEHFVGTRGGGMDHAAILASQAGSSLLIHFAPLAWEHVAIPLQWRFLVAHSMVTAEKSGSAKERYNACREAGQRALAKLGLASFKEASMNQSLNQLDEAERDAFTHVLGEAARVQQAVAALRSLDRTRFGQLLTESHTSLRDRLKVSCPALDQLVEIANQSGAYGARLTGAGFGGCVIALCSFKSVQRIADALTRRFYSHHSAFDPHKHLLIANPSNGALHA